MRLLGSLCVVLAFPVVLSAADAVKSGLWEIRLTSPDKPGASRVTKMCLPLDLAERNLTPDLFVESDCKVNRHSRNGNKYHAENVCDSATVKGSTVTDGEFLDANSFSSSTNYKGTVNDRSVTGQVQTRGKWVSSECGDVRVIGKPEVQPAVERPFADRALALLPPDYPHAKSEWKKREQKLYQDLLAHAQVDILIVPFQVQEFGLDRATRSLMTAHLALALAQTKKTLVADPYVVSRALGEGERRIERDEVYRLANTLGAKKIIWGYVGHDGTDSMVLTLETQERAADGSLDAFGKAAKKDFTGLRFADDKPPIEVYTTLLPDLVKSLGFPPAGLKEASLVSEFDASSLPTSPAAMVVRDSDPARQAYYFQILGALTPASAERTRERLFERSMLAIAQMSPRSPQYRALKTRALLYLGFRPAALAMLGRPSTLEEKELAAVLAGNLPALEALAEQTHSQMLRLLAKLDLNEMRFQYGIAYRQQSLQEYEALRLKDPTWRYLAERAFTDWHYWSQYSNLPLKQALDRDFPIPDFTADSILRSTAVLGQYDEATTSVTLSVYRHVQRALEVNAQKWCCKRFDYVLGDMDVLGFYEGLGNQNVIREAGFYTNIQALPKKSLAFIDKVDSIYREHPSLMLVRAWAEEELARTVDPADRDTRLKSARENAVKAYYWESGATQVSAGAVSVLKSTELRKLGLFQHVYVHDFPPRVTYPYWDFLLYNSAKSPEELTEQQVKIFEIALKYSAFDFRPLTDAFRSVRDSRRSEGLLKALGDRFIGNPRRAELLAANSFRRGDIEAMKEHYRAGIAAQSFYWPLYDKLGTQLIFEGKYTEASTLFLGYPGFKIEPDGDAVELSNHAYEAGSLFYWRGAVDEAIALYKIAAALDTGSGATMTSQVRLAMLAGDYPQAASMSLARATRYNSTYAYRDYLGLLHILAYSKEAWQAFETLVQQLPTQPHVWETALVGHRLEGRSDSDIITWAKQKHLRKAGDGPFNYAARYLVAGGVVDREPSKQLASAISEIEGTTWQFRDERNQRAAVVRKNDATGEYLHVGRKNAVFALAPYEKTTLTVVKSDLVYFVEAYSEMRRNNFGQAHVAFQQAFATYDVSVNAHRYLLPYYAIAAAKVGAAKDVEKLLEGLPPEWHDFDHYLAKGAIAAIAGDKNTALQSLQDGLNRRPFTEYRPLPVEYQYADVCEWLFELTKQSEYRDRALEWAKKNQRMQPWHAWAYAMEAKLSADASDRKRALGIALYLDARSSRLKHFGKQERDAASKAFEQSNPFRKGDDAKQTKNGKT